MNANHKRETLQFVLLIHVSLAVLTGLTFLNYQYSLNEPAALYFAAPWVGAEKWLQEGLSPYSPEVRTAIRALLTGQAGIDPMTGPAGLFSYPLFSMILFAPIGIMDLPLAGAVWRTLLEISLVATALLSSQLAGWKLKPIQLGAVIVFCILWFPGIRTLIQGQITGLVAAVIIGALVCVKNHHDLEGGLLLSFSLIKPEMSFLLVIFSLGWAFSANRSRIAGGIAAGFLFLVVGSIIFLPEWPLQWLQQLIDSYRNNGGNGSLVSMVSSIAPGIKTTFSLVLTGILLVYMFLEWLFAWKREVNAFIWVSLFTLLISALLTMPAASANGLVLLPVFFLAFSIWQQRWADRSQNAAYGVLAIILVTGWGLSILSSGSTTETIPVVMFIPAMALLFLWWTRSWAARPAALPFDTLQGY